MIKIIKEDRETKNAHEEYREKLLNILENQTLAVKDDLLGILDRYYVDADRRDDIPPEILQFTRGYVQALYRSKAIDTYAHGDLQRIFML